MVGHGEASGPHLTEACPGSSGKAVCEAEQGLGFNQLRGLDKLFVPPNLDFHIEVGVTMLSASEDCWRVSCVDHSTLLLLALAE